jgi:hypothetical protein
MCIRFLDARKRAPEAEGGAEYQGETCQEEGEESAEGKDEAHDEGSG